ncbi:hypothetical protein D3C75_1276970 [compost metagenome]
MDDQLKQLAEKVISKTSLTVDDADLVNDLCSLTALSLLYFQLNPALLLPPEDHPSN